MRVALVLLGCGLLACQRKGEEGLGLSARPAEVKLDLQHLDRPEELLKALSMTGRQLDRALGAHRVEARSVLAVAEPGRAGDELEGELRLDSDGKGAFHLLHDSSHGDGLEAIATGGELFVRPRYAPFVRRRPEGDELERLRANVESAAHGHLAPFRRWLVVQAKGPIQLAGRSGLRFGLGAASSPSSAPPEANPARAWRDSMELRSLVGEVVLEQATGAPLRLELKASYLLAAEGDKRPTQVTLSFTQTVGPSASPIAAPAEALAAPARSRPMLEHRPLLEGLAGTSPGKAP